MLIFVRMRCTRFNLLKEERLSMVSEERLTLERVKLERLVKWVKW